MIPSYLCDISTAAKVLHAQHPADAADFLHDNFRGVQILLVTKAKTSFVPDIIQLLLDNTYSVASIEVPFV